MCCTYASIVATYLEILNMRSIVRIAAYRATYEHTIQFKGYVTQARRSRVGKLWVILHNVLQKQVNLKHLCDAPSLRKVW